MKRVGNLMPAIAEMDNLMLAFCKARRGKQCKRDVVDYSLNITENLQSLRERIINGTLRVGNYHYFEIFDPKKRTICAASFEERIVHHAVMNVCKERFERHLIFDTYATREGKGVYAAIDRARGAMLKYRYVAKLDVRKYFDSINHDVLKNKLARLFKDRELLQLFGSIIDSYEVLPNVGIPIGNLTSQYFANYYLSALDHYVKEVLRVPVYVRYMDDMLLFADDRSELRAIVSNVEAYLADNLHLSLKPAQVSNVNSGVSFLGYRLLPHRLLLNRRSKLRLVKKFYSYNSMLESGKWNENTYLQHIQPLFAFADKAQTLSLRKRLCESYAEGG
ncbi:MAG: RNA-directed DNA polymerase [Alistipes sp.]|nr:RNA-directed DNA polymerase [Alistipes sp.]